MEFLVREIEAAARGGLRLLVAHAALSVPDICSALETDAPADGIGKRYARWFEKYLPRYVGFLSGGDAWALRNAMLHQGQAMNARLSVTVHWSALHGPVVHLNRVEHADRPAEVILDPRAFVADVIAGARAWEEATEGDPDVQRRKSNLLSFYPEGTGSGSFRLPTLS